MQPSDEYVDYSCSTSIERLARDVETLLRKWYLVDTDRHVSFERSAPSLPKKKQNSQPEFLRNLSHFFGVDKEEQKLKQKQKQKELRDSEAKRASGPVQLIRSDIIHWNFEKKKHKLKLELWDAPSNSALSQTMPIPLSLCRLPVTSTPSQLMENFTTTFGIGQHLVLSLAGVGGDTNHIEQTLTVSLGRRHHKAISPVILTHTLSHKLQTALQLACASIRCAIPAFGVWGVYDPSDTDGAGFYPPWLRFPKSQRQKKSSRSRRSAKSAISVPPLLSSHMSSGTAFRFYFVPPSDDQRFSLTKWIHLFHRSTDTDSPVILCAARHIYIWQASMTSFPRGPDVWRQNIQYIGDYCETVHDYQEACRRYGIYLMEQAVGASSLQPLWGKAKDPIQHVRLTATWSSTVREESGEYKPILKVPLQTDAAAKTMTRQDWQCLRQSIDEAVPDPYQPSADLRVNVSFILAQDTPRRNNLLLLLASLIRTSVLPPNTTYSQLLEPSTLEEWSHPDMESRTLKVVNGALVGEISRRLVRALNWGVLSEVSMKSMGAADLLRSVFDPIHTLRFPEPPELPGLSEQQLLFQPLLKSAPVGRLLSTLFVKMASLKSPSNMAVVWQHFVEELRRRWRTKESLPNMNYVPGLDLSAEELSRGMCCVSSIGLKANNAAFLHSSEPDPDHQHCLIGQKMQVFNLGIEAMVAMEMHQLELIEQHNGYSEDPEQTVIWTDQNGNTYSVDISDDDDDDDDDYDDDDDMEFGFSGGRSVVDTRSLAETLGTSKYDFFDAAQSMAGHTNAFDDDQSSGSGGIPIIADKRKGARCPVHGLNLVESQDQVYAPYLQRPHPLTDDIIHERKLMLSQHWNSPKKSAKKTLHFRIGIAQRLQKPKLLSDMCAFQSANPGALFDDFVNWYGNPGNPLEEYKDEEMISPAQPEELHKKSVGVKMDLASEAIQVLNATRDFWTATWEEASPVAAIDQEPLFDIDTTVERMLESFETIHPAELMNQIMAVNLSMSYFSLAASAGKAKNIESVKSKLLSLRDCVQRALSLLSQDVVKKGKLSRAGNKLQTRYASTDTIKACEEACTLLGETETLMAQGMSLLHKFPRQYDLAEEILSNSQSDEPIPLEGKDARGGILGVIHRRQAGSSRLPRPSMREYVLRNTDDGMPCQLSLRYAENGSASDDSGIMVGLLTNKN